MNSSIKIAFVPTEYLPLPPIKGGAVEQWIQNVSERLAERNENEIYVFSIYEKSLGFHNRVNNINYNRFKPGIISKILLCTYKLPFKNDASRFLQFPYSFWCAYKLSRIKPNIIHIHNRPQFVWIIRLLNPKSRIILHLHQVSAIEDSKILWNKELFNQVDLFVGCSQFIVNEIVNRFPLLKQKTEVIYNGIDISKHSFIWDNIKEREILRKNLNINKEIVLLYVGRLTEPKGCHILIEAVKILIRKGNVNIRLIICGGSGYSDNTTTNYVKRLHKITEGINENINFVGYIKHDEMIMYYKIADFVVIPSIVEEGFCVVTLESMAIGIPIIANAKGALPEIIDNGKNGVLVYDFSPEALANKIENIISNNNIHYANNGRKTVENKFNWNGIVETLENVYRERVINAHNN